MQHIDTHTQKRERKETERRKKEKERKEWRVTPLAGRRKQKEGKNDKEEGGKNG